MGPRVVREGWSESRASGAVILQDPARGEVALIGLAAALVDLADGTRSPAALAAALQADLEDIFAALDELADHGLLAARVAPPAGPRPLTRREVLRTFAAAATFVALPALPAAAAPDKRLLANVPALAEQDEKMLAAKPPGEQVYKEGSAKAEQHRKLKSMAWSEQDEKVAPALLQEQNKKAEADLLRAYVDAARAEPSADEQKEKQRVGAPADLAGMDEAKRKAQVQPLRAQEEGIKVAALKGEQDLKLSAQSEQGIKLTAREQLSKVHGDFGDAEEQDAKAMVAASERRRKQQAVPDVDLYLARERRAKRLAGESAAEEQAAKDMVQAQEQGVKDARGARLADEQKEKLSVADGKQQQAKERLKKQEALRDEAFAVRRSELAARAEMQKKKALTDKAGEQDLKQASAEQKQKDDAVIVELRAGEHDAKSTVQVGTLK